MSIIIVIAAFLAGILIGHGYHAVKGMDRDEELRRAREDADFWHEQSDNWHQLAVAAGAGQQRKPQKVQRITVPRPPQDEVVAAGRTGIKVWKN